MEEEGGAGDGCSGMEATRNQAPLQAEAPLRCGGVKKII